ncbi:MAG: isocitrate lyase/phosphoenolpyruvate mutase family protein [Methylocystaceae bacterium]|nr:isocitrate lyase/phosphoenolpyruvate mutase family protein [Methylocystaceae bacterium]
MDKVQLFRDLHHQDQPFVLPNVWDAGGAYMVQNLGFRAVATTSAGIAYSNGVPDGSIVDASLMFDTIGRIVQAVDIPVTADIESGYGDIAGSIQKLKELGVVGANLEDAVGENIHDLLSFDEALAAVGEAKKAAGDDFVLNARTDTFLTGQSDALKQAIERGQAFVEAGADCIFVPGAREKDDIATLVKEIPAPINIVAGLSGKVLSVEEYGACGVKRISTGGSLMRRAYRALQDSLLEMRDQGSFEYAYQAIADVDMNKLYKK